MVFLWSNDDKRRKKLCTRSLVRTKERKWSLFLRIIGRCFFAVAPQLNQKRSNYEWCQLNHMSLKCSMCIVMTKNTAVYSLAYPRFWIFLRPLENIFLSKMHRTMKLYYKNGQIPWWNNCTKCICDLIIAALRSKIEFTTRPRRSQIKTTSSFFHSKIVKWHLWSRYLTKMKAISQCLKFIQNVSF